MVIGIHSTVKLRAVLCKHAISIYFIQNCRNYDINSVHKSHQCSYRMLESNNFIIENESLFGRYIF